jgi:hypothetical protein
VSVASGRIQVKGKLPKEWVCSAGECEEHRSSEPERHDSQIKVIINDHWRSTQNVCEALWLLAGAFFLQLSNSNQINVPKILLNLKKCTYI